MGIPSKIDIAGHSIAVEWDGEITIWGLYEHDAKRIVLNSVLKQPGHPQLWPTFWHELAHAVSYLTTAHYSLFENDDNKEEAFARLLEQQFIPVIEKLLRAKARKRSKR